MENDRTEFPQQCCLSVLIFGALVARGRATENVHVFQINKLQTWQELTIPVHRKKCVLACRICDGLIFAAPGSEPYRITLQLRLQSFSRLSLLYKSCLPGIYMPRSLTTTIAHFGVTTLPRQDYCEGTPAPPALSVRWSNGTTRLAHRENPENGPAAAQKPPVVPKASTFSLQITGDNRFS